MNFYDQIDHAEDKPSKTSTASPVLQKVGASRLLCATEEEQNFRNKEGSLTAN